MLIKVDRNTWLNPEKVSTVRLLNATTTPQIQIRMDTDVVLVEGDDITLVVDRINGTKVGINDIPWDHIEAFQVFGKNYHPDGVRVILKDFAPYTPGVNEPKDVLSSKAKPVAE